MAYNYNLRLFKSRIAGNIEVDKHKELISRSLKKYSNYGIYI